MPVPGKNARKILERDREVIGNLTRDYPMAISHGRGEFLFDVDGNRFLDFVSGVAVCNLGHTHPEVNAVVAEQLKKISHYAFSDFYAELPVQVAEKLCSLAPIKGGKKVFFSNSGAESVECALKLARWHTRKPKFIAFMRAFHGRTMGALSLTGTKPVHRDGFSPLVPEVEHAPYAYCYRCFFRLEYPDCNIHCADYIEDVLFKTICPPEETGGLIVEPIQGVAGYVVPPAEFLQRLQKICNKNGIVFITDEVQTGLCRTGKWFASEVFGIEPDVMCLAKCIANGIPLGAVIAKDRYMRWPSGAHANTFGANALACAASKKTLEIMARDRLWERAEKLGKLAMDYLNDLKESSRILGDVRGKGLMIGVEFVKDKKTKHIAAEETNKVLELAFKSGLILMGGGFSTIRIAPALNIQKDNLERGLETFADVVKKVERSSK